MLNILGARLAAIARIISDHEHLARFDHLTRRGFTAAAVWLVTGSFSPSRTGHPLGRAQCGECDCNGARCGTCAPDPGRCYAIPGYPEPPASHCWCCGSRKDPQLYCDCIDENDKRCMCVGSDDACSESILY